MAPEQEPGAPPARPRRGPDLALRIVGAVVAVWTGVLAAGLELIFATGAWELVKGRPEGVSRTVVGIAVGLGGVAGAIALTVLLGWFAHAAVGTRWAAALPALPWFVVVVAGGFRTTEGDLALTGDNVLGLGLIVAGAVTFAVLGFRQLVVPPPTH
ncbi:hypothetical protein [Micromonospora auratinigra]|nr:hypothetical protein [Micromonospora auratinigra]